MQQDNQRQGNLYVSASRTAGGQDLRRIPVHPAHFSYIPPPKGATILRVCSLELRLLLLLHSLVAFVRVLSIRIRDDDNDRGDNSRVKQRKKKNNLF